MMRPLIAICIATYHRPYQLERTLKSLPQYLPEPYDAEIRVVDNDKNRSAEPVVTAFASESRIPTHYAVEPCQNIAIARNHAISMGLADYVLFIDDDEVASRDWLVHMVHALQQTHADTVIGPVIGMLPEDAPPWCERGGWFNKPVPKDNGMMHWTGTRTSNTLVRGKWFYKKGLRFDPAYGRSGGSDVALFKEIARLGGRFHAASNAVVYETIPPNRACLNWLIRRHYRGGLIYQRMYESKRFSALRDLVRRATKVGFYGVKSIFSLCTGKTDDVVRVATQSALLAGGLCAWLRASSGHTYVEYKPHPEERAA